MIRSVPKMLVAFDCEWVPDPKAARLIFPDCAAADDATALKRLWQANGATEEMPTPFVRLMQSRVVSIAMLMRTASEVPGQPATLRLIALPKDPNSEADRSEKKIVGGFLAAVARSTPQLVGFNSRNSDLRILAQRAIALGVPAKTFFSQPPKPWDNAPDYLARDNAYALDLMDVLTGGFGGRNGGVSLHEAAVLCGIPGKFDAHGEEVWQMWGEQKYADIVHYNCFDALTTYLLWLRMAWVSGLFSNDEYEDEQELLRQYLMELADKPETAYIEAFISEWDRLQELHNA